MSALLQFYPLVVPLLNMHIDNNNSDRILLASQLQHCYQTNTLILIETISNVKGLLGPQAVMVDEVHM